jgi:glucan phosphoethanolaminetransferase (alkaline phosphatase superfamily)
MKKLLSTVLQFVMFLLVYAIGSLFPPFHIQRMLSTTATSTHIFIMDGLLITLALYILIVLGEALMKRRCQITWTTIAFVLAVAFGYIMKFGFITHEF